LREVYCI